MIKIVVILAVMLSGNWNVYCQNSDARLIRQGAHCLATSKQDWLAIHDSKARDLKLAYIVDTKSAPGVNHLYVVEYSDSKRSRGAIFDLQFRRRAGKIIFNVQNNGKFIRTSKGIEFAEPLLGGVWTQSQLLSVIKKAEQTPLNTVELDQLLEPQPDVTCESYADRAGGPDLK